MVLRHDLLYDVKKGLYEGLLIIFLRSELSDLGILNIKELAEDFQGFHLVLKSECTVHLDEGLHHLSDGHVLKRLDDEAKVA